MKSVVALTAPAAALLANVLPLGSPALRAQEPPADVAFSVAPGSSIASDVAIPAGRALYYTSGTVPMVLDEKIPVGSRERYGMDTKTQGVGCLKAIEKLLQAKGLTMKDVVYLRVYVVPDKEKGGQCDFKGWFEAYGQFFGTTENPTKPARSTVGVAALVSPDWLIEIEAVAAYPTEMTNDH